jgi:hypothetical protein
MQGLLHLHGDAISWCDSLFSMISRPSCDTSSRHIPHTACSAVSDGCVNASPCAGLERGYALVDDRKKVVTTTLNALVATNRQWVGAKPCPQNFYW